MNDERDYSRFFTPDSVADSMALILDPQPSDVILEPSAGDGSLCKAIRKMCTKCWITAIELNPKYQPSLKEYATVVLMQNFLEWDSVSGTHQYTGIMANPPFGGGIDLRAHFDKIHELLVPGGRAVMILPEDFNIDFEVCIHPLNNWAKNRDGSVTTIKLVTFKKGST
jgi:hypothetical protein